MSYICEACNRVVPKGQPAHREVVATRPHAHPYRKDAHRNGADDPGGNGLQIVKERTVCGDCATPA